MTDINGINTGKAAGTSSSGVAGVSNKNANLGQDDFLKLLVAQMNFQNPMEPQQNGEFIAQMAQFGTVDGIQELQKSFEALTNSLQSNQALQASTLVGRKVEVRAGSIQHAQEGQPFEGSIELDNAARDLRITIRNATGETVRTQMLGDGQSGHFEFKLDGVNDANEALPPGIYSISADGMFGSERIGLPTYLAANVDSVTLGSGGASDLTLSLAGLGEAKISNIRQIS